MTDPDDPRFLAAEAAWLDTPAGSDICGSCELPYTYCGCFSEPAPYPLIEYVDDDGVAWEWWLAGAIFSAAIILAVVYSVGVIRGWWL